MTKKPTKMSPRAARTTSQVCQLKTDNLDVSDFWILHGIDTISFAQQSLGENPSQTFTIPKKTFDRMVDWYLREQKLSTVRQGEPR